MDPFDTDKRREDRTRQRRLLRLLPEKRIDLGKLPRARDYIEDEDAPLLEEWLRMKADEELAVVKGFVEELKQDLLAEIADRFMTRISGQSAYFVGRPYESFVPNIKAAVKKSQKRKPPSTDEAAALQRLIVLLVLADEVSDDDYEDSRVNRKRSTDNR